MRADRIGAAPGTGAVDHGACLDLFHLAGCGRDLNDKGRLLARAITLQVMVATRHADYTRTEAEPGRNGGMRGERREVVAEEFLAGRVVFRIRS
jgi:hypothetical protein